MKTCNIPPFEKKRADQMFSRQDYEILRTYLLKEHLQTAASMSMPDHRYTKDLLNIGNYF